MTVRELMERLSEFPEDEIVYVPVDEWDKPVQNLVLSYKGVLIDYII